MLRYQGVAQIAQLDANVHRFVRVLNRVLEQVAYQPAQHAPVAADLAGLGRIGQAMIVNFPLTATETTAVLWGGRLIPAIATAVITFLSVMSVAAAQG